MKSSKNTTIYSLKALHSCYSNTNLFSQFKEYSGTFNRTQEKVNSIEFELERGRDTIMKLQIEILCKTKELSFLKNEKRKKELNLKRSLDVIQEVLKQCEKIDKNNSNSTENDKKKTLPKIKKKMLYIKIL